MNFYLDWVAWVDKVNWSKR